MMSGGLLIAASQQQTIAQAVPDTTLGNERSVVTPSSTGGLISGGALRGKNLFHSFESFDVPAGQGFYFLGTDSLTNIFSRVTGSTPSSIMGSLGVLNSDANLVFINSNGIVFGPDANLKLTGSFLGTTANRINFSDGASFSTDGAKPSILTSSVPVGLGFGSKAAISVQNSGHTYGGITFVPLEETAPQPGLSVLPGEKLALIGGNVNFDGGIVRSPDSSIEIAGVREGTITLNSDSWKVGYNDVSDFGNLQLSARSLVETSGTTGGPITLTGRQITIEGGSLIFDRNVFGPSQGNISLNAVDSINLVGAAANQSSPSALLSQNLGIGKGGSVTIAAPTLDLRDGGQISTDTFSDGSAGDIFINSSVTKVRGFDPTADALFSNISTATFGEGQAGDLQLSTGQLDVLTGGQVGSATFGSGSGGTATVNANEIVVDGVIPSNLTPASINAAAFRTGNAGRLEINTGTLQVLNGGRVGTSTVSLGNAGDTTIKARQSVTVDGTFPGSRNPSLIDSSANVIDPSLVNVIDPSMVGTEAPFPTEGDAGSVEIITPKLTVSDGGLVTVQNEGPGNAGVLSITSNNIKVLSNSRISASTNGGNGGNVDLASDSLLLGEGSSVSASAVSQGVGGNIVITSDGIALFPNSSITANAEQGPGGRVVISTDALLRSPNTTITATSAAGPELNGFVDIQAPDTTPQPDTRVTPDVMGVPELTAACTGGAGPNEFVVTGRGGLPRSPASLQQSYSGWQAPLVSASANPVDRPSEIVEAQGWVSNGDGTVNFVAQSSSPVSSATRTDCLHESGAQNRSR